MNFLQARGRRTTERAILAKHVELKEAENEQQRAQWRVAAAQLELTAAQQAFNTAGELVRNRAEELTSMA